LLKEYPTQEFHIDLFGSWVFATHDGSARTNLYSPG
jgi:hypothetical protein